MSKELSEQIHKKAEPVIVWLKEAEEETSDEEEDGFELEYDDRAKISSIKEKKDDEKEEEPKAVPAKNGDNKNKSSGEEEDDVDIDDI